MLRTLKLAAICGALVLLLGGCSSESNGNAGSMFKVARAILLPETTDITLEQAAKVPNATIGMRLGTGNQAMLVLARFEPGQLWVAGQDLAIVTHSGRVTETQGLEHNISKLTPYSGLFPSLMPAVQGQTVHTRWFVDIGDLQVLGAPMECDADQAGPESVTILGRQIRTVHVEEVCNVPSIGWSFTNEYWISPTTGVLWQSVQHVHPKLDALTITILRPIAG